MLVTLFPTVALRNVYHESHSNVRAMHAGLQGGVNGRPDWRWKLERSSGWGMSLTKALDLGKALPPRDLLFIGIGESILGVMRPFGETVVHPVTHFDELPRGQCP